VRAAVWIFSGLAAAYAVSARAAWNQQLLGPSLLGHGEERESAVYILYDAIQTRKVFGKIRRHLCLKNSNRLTRIRRLKSNVEPGFPSRQNQVFLGVVPFEPPIQFARPDMNRKPSADDKPWQRRIAVMKKGGQLCQIHGFIGQETIWGQYLQYRSIGMPPLIVRDKCQRLGPRSPDSGRLARRTRRTATARHCHSSRI
jgi:hypothetical protein